MRDTQLLFVEGLSGSGKTTTAVWLDTRLQSERLRVNLWLEHQPEHPLNVGGTLHPSGDTTGEAFFQRYTSASFVHESLQRWHAFVRTAVQTEAISVLDSYPFQSTVRVLLQLHTTPDCMQAYADHVEALVMPLRPVLIYFSHRDLSQAFHHRSNISAQRGKAWTDYVVELSTHCPYARDQHLEGFSGALAVIRDYKQLTHCAVAPLSRPSARSGGLYRGLGGVLSADRSILRADLASDVRFPSDRCTTQMQE